MPELSPVSLPVRPAAAVLLARPEGRQFWREHPRVRPLPAQEIEAGGHPAILTRLQSVTDSAELAAIFHHDTFRVLLVDGAPGGAREPEGRRAEDEQRRDE